MTPAKIPYELDGCRIWGEPGLSSAQVRAVIQAERDRRAADAAAGRARQLTMTPAERRAGELLAEKWLDDEIGLQAASR